MSSAPSKRFILTLTLLAMLGGAALGGVFAPRSASADHFTNSTKTCTSGNSITFTCTFDIHIGEGASPDTLFAGQVVTVDLVGGTNAVFTGVAVTGGTCSATAGVATPTHIDVTVVAVSCIPGTNIILTETLTATGIGGGAVCQQPHTIGNSPILTICDPTFMVPVPTTPPTSAAQCRKDGWMTFNNPPFKNQGDCVAFVATQGKNEPGQNVPNAP